MLTAAATALTWLLWCLARNPEAQTRLRDELREAEKTGATEARGNQIAIDQLNSLTYLDAVCVSVPGSFIPVIFCTLILSQTSCCGSLPAARDISIPATSS